MGLHVIAGAGAIGTATARQLAASGERVRIITRSGGGPEHPLVERVAADVTDTAAVAALLDGARTLYNAAAPAYQHWRTAFPPLAASLLAAAEKAGTDLVILGNVYGYGYGYGHGSGRGDAQGRGGAAALTPDLPLRPVSDKGRVRAAMWQEALAAHGAGRVRAAEVRASDFLGATAVGLLPLMVVPAVLAGEEVAAPIALDAPHAWSYVEDVARTLIAVAARDDTWGRAWHVPSTSELSARELMARLADLAGAPAPRLRTMTPQELAAAVAVDELMAELPEMAYLYDRPLRLDASDTERLLGVRATAPDTVLRELLPAGPR
ncbi:NAD-dependent epimerase/dehydratase family protein [Streptomyces sp. NPDC046866]|uniref:NAD-dependent epimerase/dehydratase family protein n=1 Tax=Streptomyces sp. NPDC046866 TaxID=3154921 RepID=UPI003455411C